jgi:hypothetical protein
VQWANCGAWPRLTFGRQRRRRPRAAGPPRRRERRWRQCRAGQSLPAASIRTLSANGGDAPNCSAWARTQFAVALRSSAVRARAAGPPRQREPRRPCRRRQQRRPGRVAPPGTTRRTAAPGRARGSLNGDRERARMRRLRPPLRRAPRVGGTAAIVTSWPLLPAESIPARSGGCATRLTRCVTVHAVRGPSAGRLRQ